MNLAKSYRGIVRSSSEVEKIFELMEHRLGKYNPTNAYSILFYSILVSYYVIESFSLADSSSFYNIVYFYFL